MSLLFDCHLTLYAIIAAYKVVGNYFPFKYNEKNTWYKIDVHLKSKDTKFIYTHTLALNIKVFKRILDPKLKCN